MNDFFGLLASTANDTSYQQDLKAIVSVLSGVITAGLIARIIVCAIKMSHDENKEVQKKSIKHCIIALIINLCVIDIYYILNKYFGFGVFI
ncbi:MAG: hypothetical protein HFE79_07750 [Ruminiclostridium sp.]|nr:hypothetical protein [Ruminiclostridium sp.]